MASTVLPNGIIIPEKYSRDWYNDLYHNWQELDNLLGGGTPKDGTLTIQKNGDTVGTFSANQATNETINITVPDVNDATLTIQQNGTTVDTFTANSSTDKTVNIQCVDLVNNQTVAGDKEFTGTTTAHDLVPSATDTYNFGSSTAQWNNAYIKSLTINGVACGDILTHNVSEFVNVTTTQTIGGKKTFADTIKSKKEIELTGNRLAYILPEFSASYSGLSLCTHGSNGAVKLGTWKVDDNDNTKHVLDTSLGYLSLSTGAINSVNIVYLIPRNTADSKLGDSTNKWKSFNGINPGALSLPSSTYVNLDTTNFDVTATTIGTFTPTVDGWAILSISQKNKHFGIWILNGGYRATFHSVYHQGDYMIFALMPVRANVTTTVYCTADDIDSTRKIDWLRLFPCQGNV